MNRNKIISELCKYGIKKCEHCGKSLIQEEIVTVKKINSSTIDCKTFNMLKYK